MEQPVSSIHKWVPGMPYIVGVQSERVLIWYVHIEYSEEAREENEV